MSNQNYLNVCVVTEKPIEGSDEKKTYWTKVGAAFPFKDSDGFRVVITQGISVSGELVVIPPKAQDDPDDAQ